MESIPEFISSTITPEPHRTNLPAAHCIEDPIAGLGTETDPHAFEISVFNYFLANRGSLGISKVWQCRNVRIDGLLDLIDGRRVGLEVKYRMNWEKACQAGAQFSWYRKHGSRTEKPITSALVVFESFSGDWARRKPSWLLENGWNYWYIEHHDVEDLRVDLVRLRNGTLESFPTSLEAAAGGAPALK